MERIANQIWQACANCDDAWRGANGEKKPRLEDVIFEDDPNNFSRIDFQTTRSDTGQTIELRKLYPNCLLKPCPKGVLGG